MSKGYYDVNNLLNKYNEERDEAVMSFDVQTFRKFAEKWGLMMPSSNKVVEIIMRKMAYHITTIPKDIREDSKKWLEDRGYTTSLGE